jgi:hypothetical protein
MSNQPGRFSCGKAVIARKRAGRGRRFLDDPMIPPSGSGFLVLAEINTLRVADDPLGARSILPTTPFVWSNPPRRLGDVPFLMVVGWKNDV